MYKKIMAPLDGSDPAESILPHLKYLASVCGATQVVLVRVVDPITLPASVPALGKFGFTEKNRKLMEENRKKAAEEYLKRIADSINIPGTDFRHEVLEGKPAEMVADYAGRHGIDLIVIASHGHSGVRRWVLGSVADRIVRNSCVPVMMIKAPGCQPG